MDKKVLCDYFTRHRQEMVADICRLVCIDSVRSAAQAGMPYGIGPAAALNTAMEMARGMAFPFPKTYG